MRSVANAVCQAPISLLKPEENSGSSSGTQIEEKEIRMSWQKEIVELQMKLDQATHN